MRILLLNPPFLKRYSRQSRSPCVTKGGTFYYPYYLAYATGVLEYANFKVKLIDAVANNWDKEKTLKFIKKFCPDIVVCDTSTPSIYNDIEFASKIKDISGAFIILVGKHVSDLPVETLKMNKNLDLIAIGEYDYTLRDVANAIDNNRDMLNIKGIAYRKNKKIKITRPRNFIKNLDELPFVSEVYKRHLPIKRYFYASLLWPQVTILTARGCPYNCSFCNIPFKSSYRMRSIENVVDEFEYIEQELGFVKEVMIEDDTFPVSKKRTINLCKELRKRKIKLKWSCNARVNTDFETLREMKRAGCRLLCVGFESPNQDVLNDIHKGITKEMQLCFKKNTDKLGLLVNGCFILGLPKDNWRKVKLNAEFAKLVDCDTSQFYPLMVYPGTDDYKWAKENGYLITENYRKWITEQGLHTTTVDRPYMKAKTLLKYCNIARRKFYLRPTYIFKKVKQSLKKDEFVRNFLAFKVFIKHLLTP